MMLVSVAEDEKNLRYGEVDNIDNKNFLLRWFIHI
jgi:hypothetical protein